MTNPERNPAMTDSTREETWGKFQPDGTFTETTFVVIEGSDNDDVVEVDYVLFVQMLTSQGWSQRAHPDTAEDNRRDLTSKAAHNGPAIVNPEDGPDAE